MVQVIKVCLHVLLVPHACCLPTGVDCSLMLSKYSRPSLIRTQLLLRNLANPHKLKIILIIDFEFKGHVMRMRITYSSCKLLILFVRKLTKAYKVNRIAINYWQISLELAYPYLKGKVLLFH